MTESFRQIGINQGFSKRPRRRAIALTASRVAVLGKATSFRLRRFAGGKSRAAFGAKIFRDGHENAGKPRDAVVLSPGKDA